MGGYFFIYKVNKQGVEDLIVLVSSEREVVTAYEEKLKGDEEKEIEKNLHKKIPIGYRDSEVIMSIYEAEAKSNVVVRDLAILNENVTDVKSEESNDTEETKEDEIKDMTVKIEVEAKSYQGINDFIREVENMDRIMEVQNIGFDIPVVKDTGDERLVVQLDIGLYYVESGEEVEDVLNSQDTPKPSYKQDPTYNKR